jgi:type I restriction enzyme S subunit
MKNISKRVFLNLKIALPTIGEQRKIAEILLSIDKKVTIEQAKLDRLENIKNGLMQVLLTGKVRVKVDE